MSITYGNVGTYIGGTRGISLVMPPKSPTGRRATLVPCARCELRIKPGAFHICIDLSTPEPKPESPKPKARKVKKKQAVRRQPRAALTPDELERRRARDRDYKRELRARSLCAVGCGAQVSKPGIKCLTCSRLARRAFNAEREAEIVRVYLGGKSTTDVGIQFGVAANTIREVLERNGVPRRKPTGRPGRSA